MQNYVIKNTIIYRNNFITLNSVMKKKSVWIFLHSKVKLMKL